jgi:hypothetical protein
MTDLPDGRGVARTAAGGCLVLRPGERRKAGLSRHWREGSRRQAPADLWEALMSPQERVQVGGIVQVERRIREPK